MNPSEFPRRTEAELRRRQAEGTLRVRQAADFRLLAQTLGLEAQYDLLVNVRGGGLTGQADAIKQGAARALCDLSPDNRKPLKVEGHLSRDPRAKERRKYGLKKARKAPQFSKR